jgi:RimJ/RimL family protein N-acetyltransferase
MVFSLRLVPIEQEFEIARGFVNDRSLQIGHLLPLNEKLLGEYFPADRSYMLLQGRKPVALFTYYPGVQKGVAIARFRVIAQSSAGFKEAVKKVEMTAVAGEKLITRTTACGYEKETVEAFKRLGYRVGVSMPETVSLNGRRFDYHFLYKDLTGQYRFPIKRSYATAGLYPSAEVPSAMNPRLKVRGYRAEDRAALDKFASHPMVIRGLASGVFEGLYPWIPGSYQKMVDSGKIYPLVCEDEATGEPVGIIDLFKHSQDVMQHCMLVGMFVRPEYQGIGVGTMLMENVKTLAKRLHLARIWLSVFEGNTPAERLYRKAGFVECGKVPGWLQEGYVNEIFMTLKLD